MKSQVPSASPYPAHQGPSILESFPELLKALPLVTLLRENLRAPWAAEEVLGWMGGLSISPVPTPDPWLGT